MSALLDTLNANGKIAQAKANAEKTANDEQAMQRANSARAQGTADATERIPEIELKLAAAAKNNEKKLRVSLASPGDTSNLTPRASAECRKLIDYFQKQGLTAKQDYDYDSGSGDSYYGGPHWEHYVELSW